MRFLQNELRLGIHTSGVALMWVNILLSKISQPVGATDWKVPHSAAETVRRRRPPVPVDGANFFELNRM